MAEDDRINPKTKRPYWDERAARRKGVRQGAGYGGGSRNRRSSRGIGAKRRGRR